MKEVPVILFGAGGVGAALIRQIVNGRSHTASRNHCRFNIIAITDSKTMLWEQPGLSDEQLLEAVAAKRQGLPVDPAYRTRQPTSQVRPSEADILQKVADAGVGSAIVVDVTAADGLEPMLTKALAQGHSVVLANKKPLAGAWETAVSFYNHPRLRHESTVGGGQPVIATLRYLLDVNDPIYQIEGQLSGTLGFICGRLDEGIPLSQAITEAKAKGYTEPDPREDLGGQDVMRKVMILGRMAGWPLEANDIEVESLYTPNLANLSVTEFLEAASQLDEPMRQRVEAARANGQVLRYVAELAEGHGKVGLKPIPASSPLANMKYISFRTGFYNDEPLLIGGKGAGVEMTAAGVLGDMIALVREQTCANKHRKGRPGGSPLQNPTIYTTNKESKMKTIIHTDDAPKAVGPYSQAVRTGNLLFTAGQVALNPATGKMVEGDIAAQAEQVMKNLHAVLTEAGTSFDHVVKTTVFLVDMADYAGLNEVYGRYIGNTPPARSAFAVRGLPLGAKVEIEMVVEIPEAN